MNQDTLFSKAFEWKQNKPWLAFTESQIFAAELNGETCYLQIMGNEDQGHMLTAFLGKEGRISLIRLFQALQAEDMLEIRAAAHAVNAVSCRFGTKDKLDKVQQEAVRKFAKEHGMALRGRNAWPILERMRRFRCREPITSQEDADTLSEALDLCSWLMNNMKKEDIRIPAMITDSGEFLCFRRETNGYSVHEIPMENPGPVVYPSGSTENELCKEKVKRLPKKGNWACELFSGSVPGPAEGTNEFVYPWHLLTVRMDTKAPVDVQPVRDYDVRTNVVLDKLMDAMIRENLCPAGLTVSDDRTYVLLDKWCREMGIRLQKRDKPDQIEMLEMECEPEIETDDLYGDPDAFLETESMLDFLLRVPEELLAADPRMLAEGMELLEEMKQHPAVPETLRKKAKVLHDRLSSFKDRRKDGKRKKQAAKIKTQGPEKSFVISVSLDSGCYRHIKISNHAMLIDLSDGILNAFDFDNDHAHAFFMDNRAFSRYNCYYMPGIDPYYPATDENSLDDAGLQTGMKFKYVFDFGDEWIFQCRVLKELDEKTKTPVVVREKGRPPEQYPDWDDDGEDWDDDDDSDW